MTTVGMIFLLIVLFQAKHYVCDFLLQNKWMLGKFKPDWSFLLPLFAHAGVHGCFTLAICLVFAPRLWWLAIADAVIHFLMDRAKAGQRYLGRFKALSGEEMRQEAYILEQAKDWRANPDKYGRDFDNHAKMLETRAWQRIKSNTHFWWALGLDQMVHHLSHYAFIAMIIWS